MISEEVKIQDEVSINTKPAKKWERIYKFLLEVRKPVPAYTLMHALNMSRTEFYNAIKWLKMMDLIAIELDPNDMRKHLYKVKKSLDEVL